MHQFFPNVDIPDINVELKVVWSNKNLVLVAAIDNFEKKRERNLGAFSLPWQELCPPDFLMGRNKHRICPFAIHYKNGGG